MEKFTPLDKNFTLLPAVTALTNITSAQSSSLTSATETTSTSFEKASSNATVTSIKFTKRYGVSESLTSIANDLTQILLKFALASKYLVNTQEVRIQKSSIKFTEQESVSQAVSQ